MGIQIPPLWGEERPSLGELYRKKKKIIRSLDLGVGAPGVFHRRSSI